MLMGLASSPGWVHSIMLRVCEGSKRVRLFIDDLCVFGRTGLSMSVTLRDSLNDLRCLT